MRRLPFPAHHALDYLVGATLVAFSVHVRHGALLAVGGGALIALALASHGRLSVAKVVPPRAHGALDLAVALGLGAGPLVGALRPDLTGIITAEVIAVLWVRVWSLTRYRPAAREPAEASGAPVPAWARLAGPVVRSAGRSAAQVAARLPEAGGAVRDGSRRWGRRVGAAHRLWRHRDD